jgi:hypothetical protein
MAQCVNTRLKHISYFSGLRSNVNNQTEACSDHAKSFGAFTDGQQQCLFKLLIAFVVRQAELVEAATCNFMLLQTINKIAVVIF